MAETDELYELGWEQGFFYCGFWCGYTLLVLNCYIKKNTCMAATWKNIGHSDLTFDVDFGGGA